MLEKICTNLKTSKRLKELGFEAETNFLYTPTEITASKDKKLELQYWATTEYIVWKKDSLIPAYTLEQILNELPRKIASEEKDSYRYLIMETVNSFFFNCLKGRIPVDIHYLKNIRGGHAFYYANSDYDDNSDYKHCNISNNTNKATTAAKLWIKLKEDEII